MCMWELFIFMVHNVDYLQPDSLFATNRPTTKYVRRTKLFKLENTVSLLISIMYIFLYFGATSV